ncbi:hypothetical protein BYT27DRAFT_7081988, partial [Phlegmacium glaucopus]
SLPYDRRTVETLRKYFVFFRFRNSEGYRQTVHSLEQSYLKANHKGTLYPTFRPLIVQHHLRFIEDICIIFSTHVFRWNLRETTSAEDCP